MKHYSYYSEQVHRIIKKGHNITKRKIVNIKNNKGIKRTEKIINNKITRKQKRLSKKEIKQFININKQNGGKVATFQIYIFTNNKNPITSDEKIVILTLLQELYGDTINEIIDYSNFPNDYLKGQISDFVHAKSSHYKKLNEITGFSINTIPYDLNEEIMNDNKLTIEEYKIRDKLILNNIPFKLVQAQHGMWDEGIALIALERS